jgi:hypothetical protein
MSIDLDLEQNQLVVRSDIEGVLNIGIRSSLTYHMNPLAMIWWILLHVAGRRLADCLVLVVSRYQVFDPPCFDRLGCQHAKTISSGFDPVRVHLCSALEVHSSVILQSLQ